MQIKIKVKTQNNIFFINIIILKAQLKKYILNLAQLTCIFVYVMISVNLITIQLTKNTETTN